MIVPHISANGLMGWIFPRELRDNSGALITFPYTLNGGFAALTNGWTVTGSGIPGATTVSGAVTAGASSMTLSAAATATATDVTLTINSVSTPHCNTTNGSTTVTRYKPDLTTDVIDARGFHGYSFHFKDNSTSRVAVWIRWVSLADLATDLVDADAATVGAINTGEIKTLDSSLQNKWFISSEVDVLETSLAMLITGLGLIRLRFAPTTEGTSAVIKAFDSFLFHSR